MDLTEIFRLSVYAIILVAIGSIILVLMVKNKKLIQFVFFLFLLNFVLRLLLISLNEWLVFFEPKGAGERALLAFQMFFHESNYNWIDTFALQMLINIPGFLIAGESRLVLLITNAFVASIAFVFVFKVLLHVKGAKTAILGSLFISLYPAAINFSLFGLRDILIYSVIIVFIALIYAAWDCPHRTQRKLKLIAAITCSFAILSMRPELLPFLSVFLFGYIYNHYVISSKKIGNASREEVASKHALVLLMISVVVLTAAGTLYQFTLKQINRAGISPIEVINVASEARRLRSEKSTGSDSNFMSGESYAGLPWWKRWPIQTAGMIVIPFPWQVTSAPKLFAFIDSIILIYFLWRLMRKKGRANWRNKNQPEFWLVLSFLAGVLIMAMIVSNFGNAFRMRLPLMPFILLAAAVEMGQSGIIRNKINSLTAVKNNQFNQDANSYK